MYSFVILKEAYSNFFQDKSVAVDRDAQLGDCVYFQWDTLQQRLHVIQKRPSVFIRTTIANGEEAFVYMAYTINARGQFDSIVREILFDQIEDDLLLQIKVDFDLKVTGKDFEFMNFKQTKYVQHCH